MGGTSGRSGAWRARLAWAWLALVILYGLWGAATERGLYGWLMRLQVESGGTYSGSLTFAAPILLPALPSLWFLFGRLARIDAETRDSPERQRREVRRWAGGLFAVAGAALLIAAGAAAMAWSSPSPGKIQRVEAAALAAGQVPSGSHVETFGRPDPAARFEYTELNRRTADVTTVYQGFGPPAKPGSGPEAGPFALFYEGSLSGPRSEGRLADTILISGVVVENGLPELARRGLERRGVVIADRHYLLRRPDEGGGWMVAMGLGLFAAFVCAFLGATLLMVRPGGR